MNNTELILNTKAIKLELGDNYENLKEKFSGFEYEEDLFEEAGLSRQSLLFFKLGFQLDCDNYRLSTLRFYIKRSKFLAFKGKFVMLDENFWQIPSQEIFIKLCKNAGYEKWFKSYPRSIDMVNATTRFRYTSRPDFISISFDDGSLLRDKRKGH